ncbi:MAG: hypothetical protein WCK93_13005 [Nitrosomonadales bacterium]
MVGDLQFCGLNPVSTDNHGVSKHVSEASELLAVGQPDALRCIGDRMTAGKVYHPKVLIEQTEQRRAEAEN